MLPIIDWTYYSGVIHKDKNKMEESVKMFHCIGKNGQFLFQCIGKICLFLFYCIGYSVTMYLCEKVNATLTK